MDRCTGHCCKRLQVAMTPYELASKAQLRKKPHTHPPSRALCRGDCPDDMPQLAAMLEYIESTAADAHWYRCRNLQPNGDCGIYATRPKMCRDYPYGVPCRYVACTWDACNSQSACAAAFVRAWNAKNLAEAYSKADGAREQYDAALAQEGG